jgi:hypothetical protein
MAAFSEKDRLTERLVWPFMGAVCLVCAIAVIGAWGMMNGRLIAIPPFVVAAALLVPTLRLYLRWRGELAEHIPGPPPPPPLFPDAPLRAYVEPGSLPSRMAWRISQGSIVLFVLWLDWETQRGRPGQALLGGIVVAMVFTGCMSGIIDGSRWLANKWQGRRGPRLKSAHERISEARSLRGDRLKLPDPLRSSQERLR